jgi:hypothetical protein
LALFALLVYLVNVYVYKVGSSSKRRCLCG